MENTEVLNDLVEINNDRAAVYQKAKEETSDTELLALFKKMADQSRQFAEELKQLIKQDGEDPATGTSLRGKIYRAWMDIKNSVKGENKRSVLAACEFEEDGTQKAYKNALKEKLTPEASSLIQRQQLSLKESHDIVRNLRDRQPA